MQQRPVSSRSCILLAREAKDTNIYTLQYIAAALRVNLSCLVLALYDFFLATGGGGGSGEAC